MPLQSKKNDTIYKGRALYAKVSINPETGEIDIIGEPIPVDETATKIKRNGFEITYLAYLFDVFDQLGGQKYKVFKYIVEHKSNDNTLIVTIRELAKACNVSIETVRQCLKLLKEKGLIRTRTGAIMILPQIAMRGGDKKEAYLMRKFEAFEEENTSSKSNENTTDKV